MGQLHGTSPELNLPATIERHPTAALMDIKFRAEPGWFLGFLDFGQFQRRSGRLAS
jgi:hypothetical protein